MNKEDILKRAQNEMVVQTHDKAMKYTYTFIMAVALFATIRFFMGH